MAGFHQPLGPGELKGRLLVATPVLDNDNFDRTVVFLLEHGDEGALGLVLNRPSSYEVVDPLPEWSTWAAAPEVLFFGGPVSPSSVIALARFDDGAASDLEDRVLGPVGVIDLSESPDAAAGLAEVRVFAGYSGWGAGQLEGEIEEGAWYVVGAEVADVFTGDPDHLWRRVLARQPGELARVALVPADPSLN